jgi:hypothetical protein
MSKATEQAVQSRIDLATVLLRLANDQLAQGTGTSTDALRANVELHVEKENLVRAQSQTRAYGYGLAQVLGLKENQQVLAADSLTAADERVPDEQQSLAEAVPTCVVGGSALFGLALRTDACGAASGESGRDQFSRWDCGTRRGDRGNRRWSP